jgi:hypothetical protein
MLTMRRDALGKDGRLGSGLMCPNDMVRTYLAFFVAARRENCTITEKDLYGYVGVIRRSYNASNHGARSGVV